MEAELREGVMATLDAIAAEFESFRLLQEKLVGQRLKGEDLSDERPHGLRGRHRRHRPAPEDAEAEQQPHRGAGRAALCDQQAPDGPGRPPAAPGRQLRHQPRRVPEGLLRLRAASRLDRPGQGAGRALDQVRRERQRPDRRHPHTRSPRWPPRPACRSTTTAASSRPCRRASARPARPRRKWSRPTCAW